MVIHKQNWMNSIDRKITALECPSAVDVHVIFCNFGKKKKKHLMAW